MNGMPKGELLIYQTEDGKTKIDVFFEDDTIWLNQKQISQLYQKGVNTINEHIKHIFDDGELDAKATIREFRIVQKEGENFLLRFKTSFIIRCMVILLQRLSWNEPMLQKLIWGLLTLKAVR